MDETRPVGARRRPLAEERRLKGRLGRERGAQAKPADKWTFRGNELIDPIVLFPPSLDRQNGLRGTVGRVSASRVWRSLA